MAIRQKLKAWARKLKAETAALYLALKRKDTPIMAKILIAVTVGYALSPIDLIPDFIPVLGLLDDVLLLPGLIALSIKLIPKEILSECRIQAQGLWEDGRPKKFWYAVPVILIWVLIIFVVVKAIWW